MPITPSPAVLRACNVLGYLGHHPTESFTPSKLAHRVGVPRATCNSVLHAHAAHRLVTRRDDELLYELGPGNTALGDAARIANPDATPERDERARYRRALDAVRSRAFSVSVFVPRRPQLAKDFESLASSPESDEAPRIHDEFIREMMHSDYLPVDLDADENVHLGQISAPVFDPRGRVVASLLVPRPDRDITGAELHALADRLVQAASQTTRNAGGREPAPA